MSFRGGRGSFGGDRGGRGGFVARGGFGGDRGGRGGFGDRGGFGGRGAEVAASKTEAEAEEAAEAASE